MAAEEWSDKMISNMEVPVKKRQYFQSDLSIIHKYTCVYIYDVVRWVDFIALRSYLVSENVGIIR